MKVPKTTQRACQVLRAKIRLRRASLWLPDSDAENDTPRIREALREYTEYWIMPLLDAIETGDMRAQKVLGYDVREGIDTDWEGEDKE